MSGEPRSQSPGHPPNEDTSPSIKPLRRACDCCRKRKVKCDGSDPCGPCKKASIRCAYLQPPKKKGPKGLRSARVLHALRTINDTVSGETSPVSPQHHAFSDWKWGHQPRSAPYPEQTAAYATHTSVAPDETFYPTTSTTMPATELPSNLSMPGLDAQTQPWSEQVESMSATSSDAPNMVSPASSDAYSQRLPGQTFFPYIQLFFSHMFPIMPIIDRATFLNPSLYSNSSLLSPDQYCFLCAISAATIVQLDTSIPQPPPLHPTIPSDDLFAEECLRERRTYDYVGSLSTLSVMTPFFLFAYYGNHEYHAKAWHYLQESITFAENLNMDDEDSYMKLDPVESQWRRRLFWLLFVTDRGYAVQRRKHTRLMPTVQLPAIFESEDPQLLNGFVNLANLFSAVDDNFVRAWRGSRRQSLCNEAWLAETQKQLDRAALALENVSETQQMDIKVTREWLHVVAWQLGVSNGLIWGKGEGGMRLDYPIELAKKVVEITSGANALALDSHGIGMEQKLSDIAGCLADVLKCTAGDTSTTFVEGKQYLNILLQQLSSIRGRESRYLKPLMAKSEGLMGYELTNQTLPLPSEIDSTFFEATTGYPGSSMLSMADSVGMLRTLSMSGTLGMPTLAVPLENFAQRRPSGRVYDENETDALESWFGSENVPQVV